MADAKRRPLHIGVDARELLGRPTGVGRFLSEVLRAWAAAGVPHRFTLFLPADPPDWVRALGPAFTSVVSAGAAGTWWEQTRLPRLANQAAVDVLFCPAYTAPVLFARPTVLVIHDVSFFAQPEWFAPRERMRRQLVTRAAARRAREVITVSDFSAREIERWIGLPASGIRVVRHGSPQPRPASAAARPPIVLFVGSLFNRRHLPDMIAAFRDVVRRVPEARLVLVGDNRTSPPQDPMALAEAAGIAAHVDWRRYVPDAELEALYDAARVFLFLSDYEGFAMTPMEALAHGVPSVLLDTDVAREVYGPAARLVPAATDAIAGALVALLTDAAARERLAEEGRARLARSTWPRAASEVLRAIEDAAGPV